MTARPVHSGFRSAGRPRPGRRRAFTLAELLVVVAIVAVLSTLTVVAVAEIADDARLSSGKNTVSAVLDNARALAMKDNRIVLVVFRPRLDRGVPSVEAVTAGWTGDAHVAGNQIFDRFETVPDVPARALPGGIQVAGPYYRLEGTAETLGRRWDSVWVTQTHLGRVTAGEAPGELVGVMYGPDGATLTRNPRNDSRSPWVDFDRDGGPTLAGGALADPWLFDHEGDETLINLVPFLAVYDDEEAREQRGDGDWGSLPTRTLELTDYITERADRIHFNRYTGVVMR